MVIAGGGADIEGGAGGCGAVCFEPDGIHTQERWVYKGEGKGSYAQVGSMEMVGAGKGEYEKEKYVVATGARLRTCCIGAFCLGFLLALGFLMFWLFQSSDRGQADVCDMGVGGNFEALLMEMDPATKVECCSRGLTQFCNQPPPKPLDEIVVHDKYYTQVKNVRVPHMVPVPIAPPPRQVITHKVYVHTSAYNCDAVAGDYIHTWTREKQRYCCYKRMIACHTKVTVRPHYHTITHIKHVTVPVPEPIPAPPPRVINHVVNVPVHDPPQVIKVPVPGQPHVVPKYVHEKHYVPVPEPSPPTYHNVPVPVPVQEPGKVIKVPVPLPPATVVKNKVLYRTRHVKMLHVYDCDAGFSNWQSGWSSSKKSWCCSNKNKGCPGDHSGELTKTIVTHVTQHEGPSYYSHHHVDYDNYGDDTQHYVTHDYDDDAHVVHVHHYHYGSHSNFSTPDVSERRLQDSDGDFTGSEPIVGGEGTIDGGFEGGEGTIGAGFEGGEGPIEGGEGTIDGGFEGGVGAFQNENGEIENGGVVGPEWGSYGHEGPFFNTWHQGHYGYFDHAGSWVDQQFPYDAWHGHHYGHYDHAGSFVHSSYPHDAWLGGHWGHYDHSGSWIDVHHPHEVELPKVSSVVRNHFNTVYRKIPVNHYVKVQMPPQPPLVHTVQVMTPAKTYNCVGSNGQPDPTWTSQHTRWCCYKYREFCPHTVVDKNYYHTVTKVQRINVPVPEPMPTHAPIVHTIHHTYHVPSPPTYEKVHVPGPTVVKPVVVHDKVAVPVKEPPQVINVKRPYAVHFQGPNHYVKVPVPSPPHVVTHYHTAWNTVIDHSSYDCHSGLSDWHNLWSHSKRVWCCHHFNSGCPGHFEEPIHLDHPYDCGAGLANWKHGWSGGKKSWCCEHENRGCA